MRSEDVLEDVVEQLRIQNAILAELVVQQHREALAIQGRDPDGKDLPIAGIVEDHALDLEERVNLEEVDRYANP